MITTMAPISTPIVYIVDDDMEMRDAVANLLASVGIESLTFGSAAEYVDAEKRDAPSCLILDIELPDVNGLDFQQQLARGEHPPVVFITGHGDIPSSVRAMKAGAVDFLPKPFSQDDLIRATRVWTHNLIQTRAPTMAAAAR
jgi:FixJ family two-component response regulator